MDRPLGPLSSTSRHRSSTYASYILLPHYLFIFFLVCLFLLLRTVSALVKAMVTKRKAEGEGRQRVNEEEEEEEGDEEEEERREVTMLRKIWTNGAKEVYYSKLRVGDETYSCGECVMMEVDVGGE